MIFHLEYSLNTGWRTHKQQRDFHRHTIGIRCTTNFKFSARTMQMGGGKKKKVNSVPVFSFPFVPPLPSSKDQNDARNVNEQSTERQCVPFSLHSYSKHHWDLWPIVSISEKAKMCLEEQQFPCSWKTQMVNILAVVCCLQRNQYLISCPSQQRRNSLHWARC